MEHKCNKCGQLAALPNKENIACIRGACNEKMKPLTPKEAGGQEVPCTEGLCLLLKEMKEETNEYLKDYIDDLSDDLDGKTGDLIIERLGDFFDRKMYDIKRKA